MKIAPDFNLESDNGNFIHFYAVKDELFLLDFSYIGCYPCRLLSPVIESLSNQFKNEGVVIIGINPFDDLSKMRNYKEKHNINFKSVSSSREFAKEYFVSAYPTVYLISKDFKVIEKFEGYDENIGSEIEKAIENELKN